MNGLRSISMIVALAGVAMGLPAPAASLSGVVRNGQRQLSAGAAIVLIRDGGTETLRTSSDAKGRYEFSALVAGKYTVSATMGALGKATAGPFVLTDGATERVDLMLKADAADGVTFSDELKFTIAGVTDNTYRGGHGSDTMLRSAESLAKAASSLSDEPRGKRLPSTGRPQNAYEEAAAFARVGDYERAQRIVRGLLTHGDDAALHHLLAQCDEQLGDALKAVREYQRAAELNPEEPFLFDLGTELLLHRTTEAALAVFVQGNRAYPDSMRMQLGLCSARYAAGELDEAAHCFYEAADRNPRDPEPYLFLGQLEGEEITKSDGYLKRVARFAEVHPEQAEANYLYGVALLKRRAVPEDTNLTAKARGLLEKAISIDSTFGNAFLELGSLDEQQGDLKRALAEFRQAVRVAPQSEEAHYRLYSAYQKAGNPEAGRELALYQAIAKQSAEQLERDRRTLPRFVVLLQKSGKR